MIYRYIDTPLIRAVYTMKWASYFIVTFLLAASSWGDLFGFSAVTDNSDDPGAIAAQLFMTAYGSSSLTFTNAGPLDSSVTEIYFGSEDETLNLSILSATSCSDGVLFDISGARPPNPPGWWKITIASTGSEAPQPVNGINPSECLELEMSYTSSLTLAELIESEVLQVALHVASIGPYSDTFGNETTVVIPEPASLVLIGSVGSFMGFVRKRFAA